MFKITAYNIELPKIQTNGVYLSEYIKSDDRKRLYFNLNIGILQKGKIKNISMDFADIDLN